MGTELSARVRLLKSYRLDLLLLGGYRLGRVCFGEAPQFFLQWCLWQRGDKW
jgi:hypothetical protein